MEDKDMFCHRLPLLQVRSDEHGSLQDHWVVTHWSPHCSFGPAFLSGRLDDDNFYTALLRCLDDNKVKAEAEADHSAQCSGGSVLQRCCYWDETRQRETSDVRFVLLYNLVIQIAFRFLIQDVNNFVAQVRGHPPQVWIPACLPSEVPAERNIEARLTHIISIIFSIIIWSSSSSIWSSNSPQFCSIWWSALPPHHRHHRHHCKQDQWSIDHP